MYKEKFTMCVPFWGREDESKKLTGVLYRAIGYNTPDDAPIELAPTWADYKSKSFLFGVTELLGEYSNLMVTPYTHTDDSDDTAGVWAIGDGFPYPKMGCWVDDYYCMGNCYDYEFYKGEDGEEDYVELTYLCEWVISRDLYNTLVGYLTARKNNQIK